MPQDLRDGLQGCFAFQEPGRQRVTERMHALMAMDWYGYPSSPPIDIEDVIESGVAGKWLERRHQPQEHLSILGLRSSMPKIIDESLAHFVQERQFQQSPGFALVQGNA